MFTSVLGISLGIWIAVAGVAKLLRLDEFRRALSDYRLRVSAIGAVAMVWVAAEIGSGITMLIPTQYRFVPATALLGTATGAVYKRFRQGARHDCGCSAGARPIGPRTIVRNLALLALLLPASIAESAPLGIWLALFVPAGFGFGYVFVGVSQSTSSGRTHSVTPARLEVVTRFD